ncbi:MAG: metal-dependent hydrolase [Sulfurospirillaceae bacterium]|nr:metal-dependent hydrolase [Sulfurospirillaceae bacterium]
MKILEADYILTCNDNFDIIRDGAICFDENIIEVGTQDTLEKKYPQAEVTKAPKNTLIMPGLINPHVHLEFSSNRTLLKYGSFIPWLDSVIQKRDDIVGDSTMECMTKELNAMLFCGTTSLGAISSFGGELEACAKASQRVVFFNEVLGSRPDTVDVMFGDFRSRLHQSFDCASNRFFPAISIHAPYSTHPILAKNALSIAKKERLNVSTHFMESPAERAWLDSGTGEFAQFFNNFLPNARPLSSAMEYLELFDGISTLFTHCTQATPEELNKIINEGSFITHCPVSNRLLGVGKLDIETLMQKDVAFTLGTDGLSSNISLSLWDEMRFALMIHDKSSLEEISKNLIKASTCNAAKALNLACGKIEKGLCADMIALTLPQHVEDEKQIPIQLILHTKKTHWTIIDGEIKC